MFGDSRVPLRHWCYAFWRASTSKKGVSALEIERHTGLSYKSALFLLHRIRYALAPAEAGQLDGTVEVEAVKRALGKKRPPEGWPRPPGKKKRAKKDAK